MMPFSKNLQNRLKTRVGRWEGDEKCHTLCTPHHDCTHRGSIKLRKKLPARYLFHARFNKTITACAGREAFMPPTLRYKLYYEKGKDFYKA
jgi:hypothetical protein